MKLLAGPITPSPFDPDHIKTQIYGNRSLPNVCSDKRQALGKSSPADRCAGNMYRVKSANVEIGNVFFGVFETGWRQFYITPFFAV
jgi:hypothetical protein